MGLLDDLIIRAECSGTCKGLTFRYKKSVWYDDDGNFHLKESFRKLKRESCDGFCDENTDNRQCIANAFEEDIRMVGIDEIWGSMEFPYDLEDGCKVKLNINPGQRDYWTGYYEDWNYVINIADKPK